MVILYTLFIFWLIRSVRRILFWIYLWQLKEYHIGRFVDHFRTDKGQKIFVNWLVAIKIILLGIFFIKAKILVYGLVLVYGLETLKFFLDVKFKKILKPVFTKKTILLLALNLFIFFGLGLLLVLSLGDISFLPVFTFGVLLLDLLDFILISIIILSLQPFTVLLRHRILLKAKAKRDIFSNVLSIAITGSYGKTSTKEFLATILSEKYRVLKTKEHQNSEIGVAKCILNELKPEHEVFVVEMGAYGKGGIKLLCDIVKPKIGIITGVNQQHLALFGSMENLLSAEGGKELLDSLPQGGTAIVNWDNDFIKSYISKLEESPNLKFKILKYSTKEKKDIWAKDIRVEKDYISFNIATKNRKVAKFRVKVLGAHYVPNLMAAILCAREFGLGFQEIARACKKITPELTAVTLKKGIGGVDVIDATYSSNPDGVIAHLEYLKVWSGRKIIIMSCLIELGKVSQEIHRKIGRKIGEICDLAIVVTKERFNDIKAGAIESGMPEDKIIFLDQPKYILEKIKHFTNSEDVVLLEGRLPKQIINILISS